MGKSSKLTKGYYIMSSFHVTSGGASGLWFGQITGQVVGEIVGEVGDERAGSGGGSGHIVGGRRPVGSGDAVGATPPAVLTCGLQLCVGRECVGCDGPTGERGKCRLRIVLQVGDGVFIFGGLGQFVYVQLSGTGGVRAVGPRVVGGAAELLKDLLVVAVTASYKAKSGGRSTRASSPLTGDPVINRCMRTKASGMVSYSRGLLTSAMHVPLDFFARGLRVMGLSDQSRTLIKRAKIAVSSGCVLMRNHQPGPFGLFSHGKGFLAGVNTVKRNPNRCRVICSIGLSRTGGHVCVLP